jgi:hypothetical protein
MWQRPRATLEQVDVELDISPFCAGRPDVTSRENPCREKSHTSYNPRVISRPVDPTMVKHDNCLWYVLIGNVAIQ